MILQYSAWFIPFLISAVMMTALAVVGWRHRQNAVARAFTLLVSCAAIWSLGSALQTIAGDFQTSYIITIFNYPAIITLPVALLLVVFCYVGLEQYVTLKTVLISMIIPAITVVAIATNQVHHLFYTGFVPGIAETTVHWQYLHGPLFWMVSAYGYLIMLAALCLIVRQILITKTVFRQQLFFLLLAGLIPVCVNIAYTFSLPPFPPHFPLTAISFSLAGAILAPGILRFQLLSLTPASYPLIFSAMNDSVIVINTEEKVTDINPMAERMLEISGTNVIGKSAWDVFPDLVPLLDRTSTLTGNEIHTEISLEIHDNTCYFDANSIPLPAREGASPGRLILLHDITGQKKRDEALRESERRFRELVDLLPEIVFESDLAGRFTYVNDNGLRFFGHTREDLERGLDIQPHLIPEDRDRVRRDIGLRIASGEKSMGGEYTVMKRDGTRFPALVFTTCVMRNDRCTGIRGILIDITQQKKSEYAIQQAMKKLELLNSITRHDIINKLTALSAYLELAHDEQHDTVTDTYLERCSAIVGSVNEHVEFMRDYQEIGIRSPVWQDPSIAIQRITGTSGFSGIRITPPPTGWEIYTDPLFDKVIYNLIDNAIRHGGSATSIQFTLQEIPGGLLLVYEDNGAGISPEYKDTLFQKGFGKNTGLGLFLSREILEITGISIRETGILGQGARFEMLIPRGGYRKIPLPMQD